jgi:glycerol-3-phosphate O-acyltransferase 3/4
MFVLQNGMLAYVMKMMTSWAIVCDVWYLPPMTREEVPYPYQ